jgi:hypothetical protein
MRMKEKAVLIAVAAMLVLAAPVFAQSLGSQSMFRPQIKTFGILGSGIASLPSDPLNFKIAKLGVGTVRLIVLDQQTELTVGVLFLDDQRYTLKNIAIGNGSASADIYINDTQHGSLSLTSVIKGNMEIWAGTLTLDGTTYNTYILGGYRPIKAAELKEKVSEYCSENRTDRNCGGNMEAFCESNPTDTRCLALFKAYCLRGNNMDDSRCRQYMLTWCKDRNETEECRAFAIERTGAYCTSHAGTPVCNAIEMKIRNLTTAQNNYCAEHADSIGCRAYCKRYPDKCVPVETEPEPEPEPSEAELACTSSGGTVATASCCLSADDFPNACLVGACGCSAENSHDVSTCDCGEGMCFNGTACVAVEAEPEPEPSEAELACTGSGGAVASSSCCLSASDFPDTCTIGACGCSEEDSHDVSICECGSGNCFNGTACIAQGLNNETQGGQ